MKYKSISIIVISLVLNLRLGNCSDVDRGCRAPFMQLGEKCYYIETSIRANWFQANRRCRLLQSALVTFETSEDLKTLGVHIKGKNVARNWTESIWTSGTTLGENRQFFWETTGNRLAEGLWHKNEPNNLGGNEQCADIFYKNDAYLLNDAPCLRNSFYACEYSLNQWAACWCELHTRPV